MSRIGNVPVSIVKGVTVEKHDGEVVVRGPKGELRLTIPPEITCTVEGENVKVAAVSDDTYVKGLHGLMRTLINNAIIGVTTGWEKTVELVGVGYRVSGGGQKITLNVGFSHPVDVTAQTHITFTIKDNTKITISGFDKKLVGETAAKLRSIRPPEPYKGKGIRYLGEVVRKKAGKAVKTTTA